MTTNDNRQTNEAQEERATTPDSAASRSDSVPGDVLAARIVYYIGGALLTLLTLRFILALFGANRLNPFADFVFNVSYPFVSPFFGLFSYEPQHGQSVLEPATIVAMIIYGILTVGIAKLFTLNRRDPDAV